MAVRVGKKKSRPSSHEAQPRCRLVQTLSSLPPDSPSPKAGPSPPLRRSAGPDVCWPRAGPRLNSFSVTPQSLSVLLRDVGVTACSCPLAARTKPSVPGRGHHTQPGTAAHEGAQSAHSVPRGDAGFYSVWSIPSGGTQLGFDKCLLHELVN